MEMLKEPSVEEVIKLMCECEDPHAVMHHELPEGSKKGIEKAMHEDADELFRGLKKHPAAPMLGLLDAETVTAPLSYSLAKYFPAPPDSQGQVGSCTAWGTTKCVEGMHNIATGRYINLSETYYWLKQGEKPNAWISATSATKFYALRNEAWGYYARSGNAGWETQKVCAPKNARELSNLEQFMEAISQNKPCLFSFSADFNGFAPGGWVNPDKKTTNGAHLVCAISYTRGTGPDFDKMGGGYFSCINSWGSGPHAILHFPFRYVTSGAFWTNFITFSHASDMHWFDGKVPPAPTPVPPAPPKPISYDVRVECTCIEKYISKTHENRQYYKYDYKLLGEGLGDIKSWKESDQVLSWGFGRSDKEQRAVDMSKEAKQYIHSYAQNWTPGNIEVTFNDGKVVAIPLTFPKVAL